MDVDRRAQASGVASVAGVDVPADQLTLSKLTGITVQQNAPYTDGGKLDLTVTLYVVTLAASLALLGGAVVVHRRRQR